MFTKEVNNWLAQTKGIVAAGLDFDSFGMLFGGK